MSATKKSKKPSTTIVATPPHSDKVLPSGHIRPKMSKTDLINAMVELEKDRRKTTFDEAQAKRQALLQEITPVLTEFVADYIERNIDLLLNSVLDPDSGKLINDSVSQWLNGGKAHDVLDLSLDIPINDPRLLALKVRYAAIKSDGVMSQWQEEGLRRLLRKQYMADRADAIRAVLQDSGMRDQLETALDNILNKARSSES